MSHLIKGTPITSACPSAETQRTRAKASSAARKKIYYEDVVCGEPRLIIILLTIPTAHNSDLTSLGEGGAALHGKDDCHPHVRW